MFDALFPVIMLVVVLLPFVAVGLRRTAFWWLPGGILLVLAVASLISIEPVHDDVGGVGALGNGIAVLGALALGLWALLAFALGILGTKPAAAPEPAPVVSLAPATVVRDS